MLLTLSTKLQAYLEGRCFLDHIFTIHGGRELRKLCCCISTRRKTKMHLDLGENNKTTTTKKKTHLAPANALKQFTHLTCEKPATYKGL